MNFCRLREACHAHMNEQIVDNYYEANAAAVETRHESVQRPVSHLFPLDFSNDARVFWILAVAWAEISPQ